MLCLCVLCKYVNGNVYKHSVLQKKIHHKACEFVRRLLSNIHGRMRKPSVPSVTHVASSPGFSLLPRNNLRMTFDPLERKAEGEPGPFSHVIDDT